jgi:hypothetical protein
MSIGLDELEAIRLADVDGLYQDLLTAISELDATSFVPSASFDGNRKQEPRSVEVIQRRAADASWTAGVAKSWKFRYDRAAAAAVDGLAAAVLTAVGVSGFRINNGVGTVALKVELFINGVTQGSETFAASLTPDVLFDGLAEDLNPGDEIDVQITPTAYAGGADQVTGWGYVDVWLGAQHVE